MSFRNKNLDRRDRLIERRTAAELRETVAERLFETFHVRRMMPARADALGTIAWPATPGGR